MIGVVVARDEKTCRVRVEFPDRDDGEGTALVSDWLPVGQPYALGNRRYRLPDLNTQVACLMDERCEDGVVLCAIYSDADPAPVENGDLDYMEYPDGTVLKYDRAAHVLTADVKGSIHASAETEIVATAPLVKAVASTRVLCDTPLTECTGNLSVAGGISCLGTFGESGGKISTPGNIESTGGDVSDSIRSMAGDREIYDGHDHPIPGGTSGTPNQEM